MWRAYNTLVQMLHDRGFLSDESNVKTEEEFETWMSTVENRYDELSGLFQKRSGGKKNAKLKKVEKSAVIKVMWLPYFSLNTEVVQYIKGEMDRCEIFHVLVVIKGGTTPQSLSMIKMLKQTHTIEYFLEEELQTNISRHVDVDKHTICGKKEKDEVMQKYGVTKKGMPKIKVSDPQCKYLGAKKGQLIKIMRVCESTPTSPEGETLYVPSYRIVD